MRNDGPGRAQPITGGEPLREGADGRNGSTNSPEPLVGQPGLPVRAIAFSGGAYDTAMQLGVAHALLVSRAAPPDVVAGVSAGAIGAVALAAVLRAQPAPASAPLSSEDEREARLLAQVAKFREILEAYRSSPGLLFHAWLPDPYQIDAQRALEPHASPLHAPFERARRREAMSSRAGLIRLANDMLSVDVTVASLTRIARAVLGVRAAADQPAGAAVSTLLKEVPTLWALLLANSAKLAPLAGRFLFPGQPQRPDTSIRDSLTTHEGGGSAGELLSKPRRLARRLADHIRNGVGFLVLAVGLLTAPLWGLLAWGVLQPDRIRTQAVKIGRRLFRRYLEGYDVARGLLPPNPLRDILITLFDPSYYGPVSLDRAIASAFRQQSESGRGEAKRDTLKGYVSQDPAVRVEVIVADVKTGKLVALPQDTPVVDALMAATALPPWFEAQKIPPDDAGASSAAGAAASRWCVDGSAIANDPTGALLDVLRDRLDPDATVVYVYAVNGRPLSGGELGEDPEHSSSAMGRTYDSLVDITDRALHLQRFRDATLDRTMTELYTRTLPPGAAKVKVDGITRPIVRAHVFPVEPDRPIVATRRVIAAETDEARRTIIIETVAEGCRAFLEATAQDVIKNGAPVSGHPYAMRCATAMAHRLSREKRPPLPGSENALGPGLREVCAACRISGAKEPVRQAVRVMPLRRHWPVWAGGQEGPSVRSTVFRPLELTEHDVRLQKALEQFAAGANVKRVIGKGKWPLVRNGADRPLINLLFSGGVFRGVFLMGVVNALDLVGIQPDLIAGSSVGSISAAMTARVFAEEAGPSRRKAIVQLVATFLTTDHLVLSDRFADFVRGFTLRAGQCDVSIRDVDRVFRAYDREEPTSYEKDLRRVLAAVERLFYVDPFEVREMLRAVRAGHTERAWRLLKRHADEWLARGGVGMEILGAEPLDLLIRHRVLAGQDAAEARLVPIDKFLESGIFFLATATNITEGRLEILGVEQYFAREYQASLIEALLASSAFPGVFRPRRSWEIMPFSRKEHQYIDGGVMDNLPLDAVARFLYLASRAGLVARRPTAPQPTAPRSTVPKGRAQVPHLIFTGSLECNRPPLDDHGTEHVVSFWGDVARHAREFGYNRKVDGYRQMQRDLRRIHGMPGARPADYEPPLDLEVLVVKPEWLCKTFGFHPMLGFRRKMQAESIAHGCMSTLRTLSRFAQLGEEQAKWLEVWGVQPEYRQPRDRWCRRRLTADQQRKGECWWALPPTKCPFSHAELNRTKEELRAARPDNLRNGGKREKNAEPLFERESIDQIARIYERCGDPRTHQAPR